MQKGGTPATMRRWLEVADLETDPRRKADLALVVVFAQLTGCQRAWQKALGGFNVIESVIVNEWKAQAVVQNLIAILERKFPPVPDEVLAKLEATTGLDVLQRWVVAAAVADSLDAFRRDAGI